MNPAHLFQGTQRTNMRDCRRKGRLAHGVTVAQRGEANPRAKLTYAKVRRARVWAEQGVTRTEIARRLDIAISTAARIVRGVYWTEAKASRFRPEARAEAAPYRDHVPALRAPIQKSVNCR
jgi:hypothetical protein